MNEKLHQVPKVAFKTLDGLIQVRPFEDGMGEDLDRVDFIMRPYRRPVKFLMPGEKETREPQWCGEVRRYRRTCETYEGFPVFLED